MLTKGMLEANRSEVSTVMDRAGISCVRVHACVHLSEVVNTQGPFICFLNEASFHHDSGSEGVCRAVTQVQTYIYQ